MASYLGKLRLKPYKMAMSIVPKFLTLNWNISGTIWRIEVGDGSFFFGIFHALSFELNFLFDRRFPLILDLLGPRCTESGNLQLLSACSFVLFIEARSKCLRPEYQSRDLLKLKFQLKKKQKENVLLQTPSLNKCYTTRHIVSTR